MRQEAYYCTAEELVKLGKDAIPPQLISNTHLIYSCLLYTSPSPRDRTRSRMPSSA